MAWKIIRTEEAYHSALSRLEEIFDCKKGDEHYDEAELFSIIEIITHFKRILIYFQSVGPDLAKFRHFDNHLEIFNNILRFI